MYFDNYVYDNIRVQEGEVHTGDDPKTSLKWRDLRGASAKDDHGNGFALLFGKGQKLFIITHNGQVTRGEFKELNEEGHIVLENGWRIDPKTIVFMGEGGDC